MIFEWYSGSDTSLLVPKLLDQYEDEYDRMSEPERVRFLQGALDRENDRNWRGYIRYMIGDVHFFADAKEKAIFLFEQAERDFDPFAANFRDVGEEYCRTLYRLLEARYFEAGSSPIVVDLGTRIIQSLREPWLFEFERSALFSLMGGAFNDLGKTLGHVWCYRVALGYYTSAHRVEPDSPGLLESMIYCYFNLDDLEGCERMYDAFSRVAERYENKARVDEFMRTRVRLTT